MTFSAKLSNASLFKDAVGAIYELIKGDVSFKITSDGIFMNAMDPANVSMAIFKFLRPAFEAYELEEEQLITVDMERFFQVLRQAKTNDELSLSLLDNQLKVTFRGDSTRTFAIPLLESVGEGKKAPSLQFDASVVIAPNVFEQGISDAAAIGQDAIVLIASEGSFVMESVSSSGESRLTLASGDAALKSLQVQTPAKARYAIDYMKKIMKGSKISNELKISFKSDFPLQAEFTKQDIVHLSYILAPRVETE